MKRTQRALVAVAAAAILGVSAVMLTACDFGAIYDDNEKIAKTSGSSVSANLLEQNKDGKIIINVGKFSGVQTIGEKITVTDDLMYIGYDLEVTAGRFKLVAVHNDEVKVIVEGKPDENGNIFHEELGAQTMSMPSGTYDLKIVGDNASCSLEVTYK